QDRTVPRGPGELPRGDPGPWLDLAAVYLKPGSRGGHESRVFLIDLSRQLDLLALAERIGEPGLVESLGRLHVLSCDSPEAQLCALERVRLEAAPGTLILVHGSSAHRWHGPRVNPVLSNLRDLAAARGLRLHVTESSRTQHTECSLKASATT
ncbi:unnamed protein product, partial [Ixodes hexagonus]